MRVFRRESVAISSWMEDSEVNSSRSSVWKSIRNLESYLTQETTKKLVVSVAEVCVLEDDVFNWLVEVGLLEVGLVVMVNGG